jgi:hypothetical protein
MTTIPLNTDIVSANELFQLLRAMRERLPKPQALEAGQSASRLAHVDANFMQAAINTAGASEGVEKALGRSATDLRTELADIADWNTVADELRAMLKAVNSANVIRRVSNGLAGLQIYSISQQLARDPANAGLKAHIEEMKRLNRFGRRRANRTQPAPQPQTDAEAKTRQ